MNRMRNTLVCLSLSFVTLCMLSCHKTEGQKPEELAGRTAKAYYDYLIEGKYEAYTDGFYQPDSIPGSYREQLIVNAKQYAAQMKEDHGGLAAVKVAGAKADTARHTGHAFLVLCFKDSTKEEIVVPMALVVGNWMMK